MLAFLRVALLLPCLTAAAAQAQQFGFVTDINRTTIDWPGWVWSGQSTPGGYGRKFAVLNGRILYQASTREEGDELWSSDGTTAGTSMLADIRPGPWSSRPQGFTVVGNRAFFQADDGAHGPELWVTDGTAKGTVMVADIRPGILGSEPRFLSPLGPGVVFAADDGSNGNEPWYSNGLASGTRLLKDVRPGPGGSSPNGCTTNAGGTRVFLQADDGTTGLEPWVTDGTAAGTVLLKDIRTGSQPSNAFAFRPLGPSKVLFQAHDGTNGPELWVSDGTTSGTIFVKDVDPGPGGGTSLINAAPLGSPPTRWVFQGHDAKVGHEYFVTDGTAAGTYLLADINPGTASGASGAMCTNPAGTRVAMSAFDGKTYQIWTTDGTAKGTRVFAAYVGELWPMELLDDGTGRIWFAGRNLVAGAGSSPA
ncbi:MAG: hypothetical protein R3F30_06540 [Planctomycetota bacterium]